MSAMTKPQWSAFAKDVYRICKPGTGWAQLIEASAYLFCDDGTVPDDAPLWEVFSNIKRTDHFSINVGNVNSSKWERDLSGPPIMLLAFSRRLALFIFK